MDFSTPATSSSHSRDAALAKARHERDERAKLRAQEVHAVTIQRCVRSFLARRAFARGLEADLARKLSDARQLRGVLLKLGKTEWCLPRDALVGLIRFACILHRLVSERLRTRASLSSRAKGARPSARDADERARLATIVADVADWTIDSLAKSKKVEHDALLYAALVRATLSQCPEKTVALVRALVEAETSASVKGILYGCFSASQCRDLKNIAAVSSQGSQLAWTICIDMNDANVASELFGVRDILLDKGTVALVTSAERDFRVKTLRVLATRRDWPRPVGAAGGPSADAMATICLANLLTLIRAKVSVLDDDVVFEAFANLIESVPSNIYVGAAGVAWTKDVTGAGIGGTVASVDANLLDQINLQHVLSPMIQRAFAVDVRVWERRAKADAAEWSQMTAQVLEAQAAPITTSRRHRASVLSSIKDAVSSVGSTWAAKLGSRVYAFSSEAKRASQVETDEQEALIVRHRSEAAASSSTALFLRPMALTNMSRALASFLTRWPPKSTHPRTLSFMNILAFSFPTSERAWAWAEELYKTSGTSNEAARRDALIVSALVTGHLLLVVDDEELHSGAAPMSRAALERFVRRLNQFVLTTNPQLNESASPSAVLASWSSSLKDLVLGGQPVPAPSSGAPPAAAPTLPTKRSNPSDVDGFAVKVCIRVLTQLYDLHSRRALVRADAWHSVDIRALDVKFVDASAPWARKFADRAEAFQAELASRRAFYQPQHQPASFRLSVRRKYVIEDSLDAILKHDMRQRLYVVFMSELGTVEPGIDARGVSREFLTTACEKVFDPQLGLFSPAQDGDGLLMPNPKAASNWGESEALRLFEFAGRILGKAVFESITVEPVFSFFVLSKLLGRTLLTFTDLATLDRELHRNLVFLKTYDGDVSDLSLTFSVASAVTGKDVELFPGGSFCEVTRSNRFAYVNSVAYHRLHVECANFHAAFRKGFCSVLGPSLPFFSERELQALISGAGGALDMIELRRSTAYAGGYYAQAQVVSWFWDVVDNDMTEEDRSALLRFATACTRAPLLGFQHLDPHFTIQRVSLDDSTDGQLPTAATCFNTLKLPAYKSKAQLKRKLLLAVRSASGFELT